MIIDSKNVKVGDRLLIVEHAFNSTSNPVEGVLEEVSPNNEAVKINGTWYKISNIKLFDLLCESK